MKKIKLIWDFRGPGATMTAQHHEIHLRDYAFAKAYTNPITGVETISEAHATAFFVVREDQMIAVRDALKPHRGSLYLENE